MMTIMCTGIPNKQLEEIYLIMRLLLLMQLKKQHQSGKILENPIGKSLQL